MAARFITNPRRSSAKHIVSGEYDSTETSASYRYGAKVLKALRAAGVPATARYATSSAYGPWHIIVPASHEDHAEAVVAPLHAAHAKAFQRTVRKMVKRRKNPTMTDAQASTLLRQMGGMGRLVAMTGAKDFLRTERDGIPALAFKFKGSPKANYVAILLDPSDTYTLHFGKIVKYDLKPTGTFEGVYADRLKSVFEDFTGLYLSL